MTKNEKMNHTLLSIMNEASNFNQLSSPSAVKELLRDIEGMCKQALNNGKDK